MAEIAEAAETSKRTLYRYFGSREDLARSLYLENLAELASSLEPVETPSPEDPNSALFLFDQLVLRIERAMEAESFPENFLYDLSYNLYAMGRKEDPTKLPEHFFSQKWFKQLKKHWKPRAELAEQTVNLMFGTAQRLILLESQKGKDNWQRVRSRLTLVADIVRAGLLQQLEQMEAGSD